MSGFEVARIAPAAAVVQAFARVEGQLRQLLLDAGLDPGRGSAMQLARRAQEADLVQPETVRAIEGIACCETWRHTGMTELGDAAPTDAQSRAINRHGSARTLPRYVRKTRRRIIAGASQPGHLGGPSVTGPVLSGSWPSAA